MKNITTYGFRYIARQAAKTTNTKLVCSWTDHRGGNNPDNKIVTYAIRGNEKLFMETLEYLIKLSGLENPQHNLRRTYSGYVKCNCILPHFVKYS